MFVEQSVQINQPVEAVTAILVAGPREWFARLDASGKTAVGASVAGIVLRKQVAVEVGLPVTTGDWTEIPVTWRATFIEKLFPVMVGKVELAPVDARTTKLTIGGMYEPPFGPLGRRLNDAFMHTVAEATVSDLARSIAERLEAAVSTRAKKRQPV
ncbi:MAG TPA: hypothetical protein VIJ91_03015 [Candidatus Dormibacteraeota bacterium]